MKNFSNTKSLVGRVGFASSYTMLLLLLAGLIAHRSYAPVWWGRYSTLYLCGLIALGVLTIFWKPVFVALSRESVCTMGARIVRLTALHKWGLFMLILWGCAGVLEWRMRDAHPWVRQPDADLVRQFHPFLQNEVVAGNVRMHINESGFRGDPLPSLANRDVLIFMLGGSTVYSHDVPYEQSHAVLLQHRLRQAHPGVRIIVQNAGNEYHTTLHSLIKYVTRIRRHRPDIIIMWHGINDLIRSFVPNRFTMPDVPYAEDYRHSLGPIAGVVNYYATPVRTPPLVHSLLWNWLKHAWFSDIRAAIRSHREQATLKPISVDEFPSRVAFENNQEALAQLLKQDGAMVIMASEPTMYAAPHAAALEKTFWMQKSLCRMGDNYPDVTSLARGMEAFNKVTRHIAEAHGFLFLDLDALLPKEPRYMFDDCHYTPEGNARIADVLAAFLAEHRVIETVISRKVSPSTSLNKVPSALDDSRNLSDNSNNAGNIARPEVQSSIGHIDEANVFQ